MRFLKKLMTPKSPEAVRAELLYDAERELILQEMAAEAHEATCVMLQGRIERLRAELSKSGAGK